MNDDDDESDSDSDSEFEEAISKKLRFRNRVLIQRVVNLFNLKSEREKQKREEKVELTICLDK